MIFKLNVKKRTVQGGTLELSPVEILIVKDALRTYIHDKNTHNTDKIIAQHMLDEIDLYPDE